MPRISREQVLAILAEIVAADPDRVDQRAANGCAPRYTHHGEPVCLVAVALHRLGVSTESLRLLDRETHGRPVQLATSRHRAVTRLSRQARELLDECQRAQDAGWTWGGAVDRAQRRLRRRR